jgi:hypothetical protein
MNCFLRYILCMCCIADEEEVIHPNDEDTYSLMWIVDIKESHI